jgi:DNA/RNA endonuclease YhcR with UshA esterase domain
MIGFICAAQSLASAQIAQPTPAQSASSPSVTTTPAASDASTPAAMDASTPAAAQATPTAGEPAGTPPVIDATDVQKLSQLTGQTVTVEGNIVKTGTHTESGMNFLNFSHERKTGFVAVIFPRSVSNFSEPPAQMYQAKKVRITGRIEDFRGQPQIVVESPDQIKVVAETPQ